jgi:hypothetical protein
MADRLEFDLPGLKTAFDDPRYLIPRRINSLLVEVTVSPEIIAAILADELGILGSIIGPSDASSAALALERDMGK